MDNPVETPEPGHTRKGRKIWTLRTVVIVIVLASTIGVAGAVITLFTHTFPAVSSVAAVITTTCSGLTASPSQVLTGSSGSILFNCAPNAAFSATPGSVTPHFTLPTEYSSLTLIVHVAGSTSCTASTFPLTDGSPFTFVGPVSDDYCAGFSNAPAGGLPTFTVTWTQ